jgi:methylthioribose-1-phosphate isomerase
LKTLEYRDNALFLLDQTRLPHETVELRCATYQEVAGAIRRLSVRGAPAIGLAGAYGVVLAAQQLSSSTPSTFSSDLDQAIEVLRATRPTAVNLSWALERMRGVIQRHGADDPEKLADRLRQEAEVMMSEDLRANQDMGRHGAALIPDGAQILTHCNAGGLATGGFGTALGVILTAHQQRKRLHVWVDETRPLLQGARLTTWELAEAGVPHTLITDNMAGHFMAQGNVDMVMVGADRIAANGDAANKIGTYGVAVLAHAHNLPVYFVAPTSTVDLDTADGSDIPIEERSHDEVTSFFGVKTAPGDTVAANPAFDVTPARLVSAIVTETGIISAPFGPGLKQAVQSAREQQRAPVAAAEFA